MQTLTNVKDKKWPLSSKTAGDNNDNILYCDSYCRAPTYCQSEVLRYYLTKYAAKVILARTYSSSSTLYLYLARVTAEVLSKAGRPNVERFSVGTANSSLLSMLRGLRTNTCDGMLLR